MAIGHTNSVKYLDYLDGIYPVFHPEITIYETNSKNFCASGAIRSIIQLLDGNYSVYRPNYYFWIKIAKFPRNFPISN